MADVEHGDNLPADHAGGDKGNHTVEAYASVADEAARNAIIQASIDRGREIFQTAGVQPGWYRALGTTAKWVAIAGPGGIPFPDGFIDGLAAARNGASPAFKVDIGIGSARSDDNSFNFMVTSLLTADITASGVNGLDTGAEASSTWYSLWVICDTADVNPIASLLSLSAASPTLPSGYDRKRRVSWVFNDSGSDFRDFTMLIAEGRVRQIAHDNVENSVTQVLAAGAATTFASVDLSDLVPPTSTVVDLIAEHDAGTAGDFVRLRPDGSAIAEPTTRVVAGGGESSSWIRMRTSTSQVIEYENSSVSEETDIWVAGYIDVL